MPSSIFCRVEWADGVRLFALLHWELYLMFRNLSDLMLYQSQTPRQTPHQTPRQTPHQTTTTH